MLEELVIDKRFTKTKRHIRKQYLDPTTRGQPWGLIKQQDLIVGIFSTSEESPIKKVDSPLHTKNFPK